jgi:hypothetical protein
MQIKITKLTDKDLLDKACSFTVNKEVHPSLYKMYLSEHSPVRTQMFWIEMYDIYTFCSVHFVRHKFGVEHFVKSNREDRPGYTQDLGRKTLVNHAMLLNAQSLINMARKRLCYKSHDETRLIMETIKDEMKKIDTDLALCMLPDCLYRGKVCHEFKPCGKMELKC